MNTAASDRHQEQLAYWNSSGGERWVAAQEHTDTMLAPVSKALLDRANLKPGMAVLDIGCGCGAASLEAAGRVGRAGRVLGMDVSRDMLDRAKARLAARGKAGGSTPVEFVLADASGYPFTPFADIAISRFGVMFFGDPAQAFANIAKAIVPGGRLVFACWRGVQENPWMQVPLHAVYDAGIPRMPRPGPEDPGPFSFADPERVTRILTEAGFSAISPIPADFSFDIAAGGGLNAATHQAMTIGATHAALRDQPEALRVVAAGAV